MSCFAFKSLLPLLVLLAAFSSKEGFYSEYVVILSSWLLVIFSGCISIGIVKYKSIFTAITFFCVFSKLITIFFPDTLFINYIYSITFAIILGVAAIGSFLKIPKLIIKQIFIFSFISLTISLFQVLGLESFQSFGSAALDKGLSNYDVLLQKYDAVTEVSLLQSRPDGISHANNLTSQLLCFFYTYCIVFYTIIYTKKLPYINIFILSLACAINAGKVVIGCVVLLYIFLIFNKSVKKKYLAYFVCLNILAYYVYFLLFPGLFILNFNLDYVSLNILGRIANFGAVTGYDFITVFAKNYVEYFGGQYITTDYISYEINQQDINSESYSGLSRVFNYLIVFPFIIILLRNIKKTLNFGNIITPNVGLLNDCAICFGIVGFLTLFGGPFYKTVWYAYFISPFFVIYALPMLTNSFLTRSVKSFYKLNN